MNKPVIDALKVMAGEAGDRSPLYYKGVLDAVSQWERQGYLEPNRMVVIVSILCHSAHCSQELLTEDELSDGEKFVCDNGWSSLQAVQYLQGVGFVERCVLRNH